MTTTTGSDLAFSDAGERMIPEISDHSTFWEHIYRYKFACRYVKDKDVLDIASGEGYGTRALLAAGAKSVIGLDVSVEACVYARQKYAFEVSVSDALHIALSSQSLDVVTSFETIEHLSAPESFLEECRRVLRPTGKLIISTPNKDLFDATRNSQYHVHEFTATEFHAILCKHFRQIDCFAQLSEPASWFDVRTLAAKNSPWIRVRGFWQIRRLLRQRTCWHVWDSNSELYRGNPVATILKPETSFSELANPYLVTRTKKCNENVMFIVAVASV